MKQEIQTAHQNNFSILHLLGACLVILGHQYCLFNIAPPVFLGNAFHVLGVKLIFVITGFLITKSFLRKPKFGQFITKRLIRIYPAYFLCLAGTVILICLPLSAVRDLAFIKECIRYVGRNLMMQTCYCITGIFSENPYAGAINGSIWTLPLEIFMYFFIASLLSVCLKIRKYGSRIYGMIALAFIALNMVIFCRNSDLNLTIWGVNWLSQSTLNDFSYMLAGSAIAALNLETFCKWPAALAGIVIASFVSFPYAEIVYFAVICYSVVAFALDTKPFASRFFEKNNIAYGMFLWAFPLQQLIIYILYVRAGISLSPIVMFLISLPVICAAALLSHYFWETPVEKYLKKLLLKK